MLGEQYRQAVNNGWSKRDDQFSQNEPAHKPSQKDRQQKIPHFHLECARSKDKKLEWSRRRQHGRNHERKELLALEAVADGIKFFLRNPFAQRNLSALASEKVDQQTAQRRAYGRHRGVQQI